MEKPKLLFTPGPLTTSETVKQAMMRDLGSRDAEFLQVVRKIRHRLLELGNVADGSYEAVLMQGSGTFAIESVISSVLPRKVMNRIVLSSPTTSAEAALCPGCVTRSPYA